MKRTYIKPQTVVHEAEPNDIICGSKQYGSTPVGGETDEFLAPKERRGWDDYEGN